MCLFKKLGVFMLLCQLVSVANAEQIHAAVAANFTAAMKNIVAEFEESTGHKVVLSFGSSGKLFAQIQQGAPFQVFFSADQAKPEALEKAGLAVTGSRFTYAVGTLALWSAKPGFIGANYNRLQQGDFNKLALANPKLAPYGAAAVQVLKSLNLKQVTEPKWVRGENIAQTYQFVASGNADLGFVALSQIIGDGCIAKRSCWVVPVELYQPIRQDVVLLKNAEKSIAAKALLDYFRGDEASAIIHAYGYQTQSRDG